MNKNFSLTSSKSVLSPVISHQRPVKHYFGPVFDFLLKVRHRNASEGFKGFGNYASYIKITFFSLFLNF